MGVHVRDKFEQFLRVPLMVVSILAWGFVIVGGLVLAFQRMEYIGNKVTLGEVFTLASLIFALLLAGLGWLFVLGREKAERERIAKADALILYRELENFEAISTGLLCELMGYEKGNLLALFPKSIQKSVQDTKAFFEHISPFVEVVQEEAVEPAQYIGNLRTLYIHDAELGDCFMNAIDQLGSFKICIDGFPVGDIDQLAVVAMSNKVGLQMQFFSLVGTAASAALQLEHCRLMLVRRGADIAFNTAIPASKLAAFNQYFYEAHGLTDPSSEESMSETKYASMLSAVCSFYAGAHIEAREEYHSS